MAYIPDNKLIDADMKAQVEAELAQALGDHTMEQIAPPDSAPKSPASSDSPPPPDSSPDSSAATKDAQADEDEQPITMSLKRGRIATIHGDDVYVDLQGDDGKMQGLVPLKQFDREPRSGSIMDFAVDLVDEAEGIVHLSREGAVGQMTWDHLHIGSVVEARVTAMNKGGLELELVGRIRAFMPASQIDLHHVDDMEQFVGQKLIAQVQELNRRSRKVLLSRRKFLEHDRATKQRKLWEELGIGQLRDGVVTRLAPYGAFVDLGGADGLLHISDMSYGHLKKPEEAVKVGQPVQVKVLKIDQENNRISLGLKQVLPDPWDMALASIHEGDHITGKVVRLANFGAFIEVEPGVEGLLPLSEMSWKRIHQADQAVKVDDTLQLLVLKVDPEQHRISLSLKQVSGDPWATAEDNLHDHKQVQGKVVNITDFGAFVELESGVEGMVHISELSANHVERVEDVVKVGETYSFRVLKVDPGQHRIGLSLKPESTGPAPQRGGSARGPTDGRLQRNADGETVYKLDKSKITKRALKGGIDYR